MIPIGDDNSFSKTVPLLSYGIIAINVLVFLVELSSGDAFIMKRAFIPSRFKPIPSKIP